MDGPLTATAEPRTFIGVDGLVLRADQWAGAAGGDRPAILMLHGGGQTRHSWKSTATYLGDAGFDVIALDSRGHGDSEWAPDGDYSVEAITADVVAVLRSIARPVVLIGASMGGLTGLLATAIAPELVRALVMVDIVPDIEDVGRDRIESFMRGGMEGFATLDDAADAIAEYLPHRSRPYNQDGLRRNVRQGADSRWYWHWDPAFLASERTDPGLYRDDFDAAARSLTVPLLLLHGVKSDIVSESGIARMLELAPHASVVHLAAAAHTAAGDDNEAFSQAVIDFVSTL